MSKIVTIPTGGGNPFVVILGGIKYVYKPGETVEVPDGVALEIEEWERWHKKYYGENVPPFESPIDDITAEIGQTIVVKSVDENGKPTEWEAVNAGEKWELIADLSIEEAVSSIIVSTDLEEKPFELKKVYFQLYSVLDASSSNYGGYSVDLTFNNTDNVGLFSYNASFLGASVKAEGVWTAQMYECIGDGMLHGIISVGANKENTTAKMQDNYFSSNHKQYTHHPTGYIRAVHMVTNNPSGVFWGAGTTIKVYGVRA